MCPSLYRWKSLCKQSKFIFIFVEVISNYSHILSHSNMNIRHIPNKSIWHVVWTKTRGYDFVIFSKGSLFISVFYSTSFSMYPKAIIEYITKSECLLIRVDIIRSYKLKIDSISINKISTWSNPSKFFSFFFLLFSLIFINMFVIDSDHNFVNVDLTVGNFRKIFCYFIDKKSDHRSEIIFYFWLICPQKF